ncbi:IclR family transcriptional regulator [Georgenia soli]|uniref:Glycerol operon regulatory protein n=1 Tax=Georgenia soli TaxID=638953 RepID=A0A2A9ENJ1_9MICO|nr:IclR family transcriptional regulator [Georgenia soli]PFG39822.1 IclR family transcriptional regulator [Georgenia soli]
MPETLGGQEQPADHYMTGAPVLVKAVAILEAFTQGPSALGGREIARRAGLPSSTTHRMLSQLVETGFLERQGTKYRVGLKLFEVGNYAAFCEPGGMRDTALPFLSSMYVRGGDCVVTLAVRSDNRILCVEKIRGHSSPRTETRVGWPIPATQTSLGKVILAFSPAGVVKSIVGQGLMRSTPFSVHHPAQLLEQLDDIRSSGVSFDNQEAVLGLSGVAAPVFIDDEIVASIALTQPTSTFKSEYAKQLVVSTAQQLSKALQRGAERRKYMPLEQIGPIQLTQGFVK